MRLCLYDRPNPLLLSEGDFRKLLRSAQAWAFEQNPVHSSYLRLQMAPGHFLARTAQAGCAIPDHGAWNLRHLGRRCPYSG